MLFCIWEDAENLGSLKSFLSYASQPTWGQYLVFFTSGAPLREWESYWLLVIMYVSPSRVPTGLRDSR